VGPLTSPAVAVDRLSFAYPARRGAEPKRVLNDLSLTVERGEIFGVLGPNGGGKTTLFRILSTALPPPEPGKARVFDADVAADPQGVRRRIGVVFQNPSLDGKLTLLENLRAQAALYGVNGADVGPRIEGALARLGIAARGGDFVEKLSGGLQRRGEIAKSLLHQPDLLLMDEPSTGLDPGARRELWDTLKELKKARITVLLTTHLMEEGERCDRVAIVNEGRVIVAGTPAELKARIGGDVVSIQTEDPAALARDIRAKFSVEPAVLDESLRIEIRDGHKFIPALVEAFPGAVRAVSVGKPTLEDVFVRETGRRYTVEAAV
jgi:ABC-2 type transport system ATP-binding protein